VATTYIVLRETDDGEEPTFLLILGTAEGDTPREAVKTYSEPAGKEPVNGRYIAVPMRNWSEEAAEAETRVKYESSGYTDRSGVEDAGQVTIEEAIQEAEVEELAGVIEGDPPKKGDDEDDARLDR
jgi:hypothetical protein